MHIAVEHLTKRFGAVCANDRLTISFAAGQIHGVLGENGAGKSTLMKLLAGYLQPDEGRILFDHAPRRLSGPGDALAVGVGMVHQEPLDIPAFTALENLLCAAPPGVFRSRRAAQTALQELAERLGFPVDPAARLDQLTVGQRQQIEIMRLLLCGARVLILDEPTTGITAAQARSLFTALRQIAAEGRTVLFVSHKLEEVAELCHTVTVLRNGQVVPPGQLPMPQPQEYLLSLMFGEAGAEPPIYRPLPLIDAPPVWELHRVTARSGTLQLVDLNHRFAAGRIIGLAGLDGSGQQVLLRLLAGQLAPDRGRVLVNGRDLTGAGPIAFRQAGIEYLPADRLRDGMIGALSLTDHFALLQGRGALVDRRAAEEAARQAIAEYQIKATPITPIAALSGGNQQRAMLALVPPDARGILAEQPTRGLDVASARAIWGRLQARRDAGCCVIFASPDLDEIMEYSDEVIVCFAGRIGPPIPRALLSSARLAELIGGVGFDALVEAVA
ncbi:ABC transporter ATP-binding protein [Chloroflexus sp.]|uniref:ABC transporter ATP-binding protein n=1 Tax=Chloroflexus sp. TaxID=1904827 RepID=UPI0026328761|nr:ATP-binding cassette domain-containing protein [uncultured Chloroflexus sp.]